MSPFVLVPGWWLGGWAWQQVAAGLRAAGHDAYPVTLTGLDERTHLASPSVDLETHVGDVLGLLAADDLHEVVLVGHSGAGPVVTAVADRAPERLARVVYVESGPTPDGSSLLDSWPPDARAAVEKAVADEGDGWRLPLPDWDTLALTASLDGLDGPTRETFRARATDQPAGPFTQPLLRSHPTLELPMTLVSCSFPLDQVRAMIDSGHPWFAELAGPHVRLVALQTGHWPMLSRPDDLADLLAAEA
ncbi:MAG: alpha/beta fold hydrolase [Actinomycetes bacterium]